MGGDEAEMDVDDGACELDNSSGTRAELMHALFGTDSEGSDAGVDETGPDVAALRYEVLGTDTESEGEGPGGGA